MSPSELPVRELEASLVEALLTSRRVLLRAPTGSGKSTQIPQMLIDSGAVPAGEVVVLEPRRLATRMLAARVAWERKGQPGGEVGYQIRFERVVSRSTRIRFVTEGVLLRQLLADPTLSGVGAVVLDEFHERHLYGDLALAQMLELQDAARPDLVLVVMSATLDLGPTADFMAPCNVLESAGRTYPVEIRHLEKTPDFDRTPVWEVAAAEAARLSAQTEGDLLVFMPGAYEIQQTIRTIRARLSGFDVFPLYGDLPAADQDRAVEKSGRRKIVVATNVAESAITIDGIRAVIDSGLAKIPRYDPRRGIDTLLTGKISIASADQRAGRAGRTAPGVCVRLWTEREHRERPPKETPEALRVDLAEIALALKAQGVRDLADFRWLDAPDPTASERAETLLHDLGAANADGTITPVGTRMLAFPVHPRYARMLIAAEHEDCVPEAALVAALTQGRSLFVRGAGGAVEEKRETAFGEGWPSDFLRMVRGFTFAREQRFAPEACGRLGIHGGAAREAGKLWERFMAVARDGGLHVGHAELPGADRWDMRQVARCLLAGFSDHVAIRLDSGTLRCRMVHGRTGELERGSAARDAQLLVATDVLESGGRRGEVRTLFAMATAIEEAWLRELFPEDFVEEAVARFDPVQRRVVSETATRFRDLVLRSRQTDCADPEKAASLLAEQVLSGNCRLDEWDHRVDQWIFRVNRLREWMPELNLPAIGDEERLLLVEEICRGATSYREIKGRPVFDAVANYLNPSQRGAVERFVPERLQLPGGRKAKVTYAAAGPPVLAARIQDLFGVERGLAVAGGRVPVAIQVLAPNERPVQVTEDLGRFWSETYPEIKPQLSRRYPRHEWR
jgi:ATP-dependent helicase HrpB